MFQYVIVLLITIESVNADGKRLLLTDPDVEAQRLSQHESTVHQLSSTVHQLSNTVHQLSSPVHQLSNPVHQLSSTVHQFSSTVHQLSSTVHQLSSAVHQLSSTVHQLSNTVKIQSTTIQQLQQPSSATESMLKVLFVLVNDNVRSIEINFVISIVFVF